MIYLAAAAGFAVGVGAGYLWGRFSRAGTVIAASAKVEANAVVAEAVAKAKIKADADALEASLPGMSVTQTLAELEKLP